MSEPHEPQGTGAGTLAATMERYCPTCERSFTLAAELCPVDGTRLVKLSGAREWTGTVIDGRFTVGRKLGAGGMGTVYAAVQHSVGREVAIKLVHPRLTTSAVVAKRFLREVKLASRLAHPATVTVIDFGQTEDGTLYMVMELLGGRTLAEAIDREAPMSLERSVGLATQLCDALAAAHGAGIIHRDLKPSNVFLLDNPGGRDLVKVLDFGLAKSLAGDDTTVTHTGHVMGTPRYIAPELALGQPADARADLYALGVVLFELLCGRVPFEESSATELIHAHAHTPAPPLPDEIPQPIAAVVARLLEKLPSDRLQSAAQVRAALTGALAGAGTSSQEARARRTSGAPTRRRVTAWSRVAMILVVAAGVSVIVVLGSRSGGRAPPGRAVVARHTSVAPSVRPHTAVETVAAKDAGAPDVRDGRPLRFTSRPSGAAVSLDGVVLCTTPCERLVDALVQGRDVRFRRRGYVTVTRRIDAHVGDEVHVVLRRRRGGRRSSAGGGHRAEVQRSVPSADAAAAADAASYAEDFLAPSR